MRSYFLNEVDGIKRNDGILMLGSTNHLDRLDPGIAKRPSRFDRKYFFPNPNRDQREAYAGYWQGKLRSNKDIDFPDDLCKAIAGITDGFSFAYIQEAMVASLLAIAARGDKDERVSHAETRPAGLRTGQFTCTHNFASGELCDRQFQCPEHLDRHQTTHRTPLYCCPIADCSRREPNFLDICSHLLAHTCKPRAYDQQSRYEHFTLEEFSAKIRAGFSDTCPNDRGAIENLLLWLSDEHYRLGMQAQEDYDGPMRGSALRDSIWWQFGREDKLNGLVLWREFKKQVKILRDEMGGDDGEE